MKKLALFILLIFTGLRIFAQDASLDASLTESPVSVKTLSGTVEGQLVMPKNTSGKIPLVIIIADAGPTDLNGNNVKTGVAGNTYKLLANDLGKKGIATVRYDKRLVGQSVSKTKESQLHIEDYSDDVVSLMSTFTDDQRFSKIILFGHGEGALVALIAGYEQPQKGFILAEGFADRGEKIIADEMKTKPKFLADEVKAIMDSLKKGKTTATVDPSIYFIARPNIQPFIMSWCRYDPIHAVKTAKVPVMIIQGTTDLQVPVNNGERFKKAKSEATYLQVSNMNHILKEAPADPEQNVATYDKGNLPIKPEVITGIVDFINNKLK
eukprot:gene3753-3799_t